MHDYFFFLTFIGLIVQKLDTTNFALLKMKFLF